MPPNVRFAPSPTGRLHIGGVHTALFNWLFARGSRPGAPSVSSSYGASRVSRNHESEAAAT